jgi:hypothetical protein
MYGTYQLSEKMFFNKILQKKQKEFMKTELSLADCRKTLMIKGGRDELDRNC